MRILLDLDDTVIINNKLHSRFFDFQKWVKDNNHEVIIWSSRDDGSVLAALMGFSGFISKDSGERPTADYLIDDEAEHFCKYCNVPYYSKSISNFMIKLLKLKGCERDG
jgi:2-hydroxy-3-keto-5-methylthiopentenyl-1-phosphate phosphatase